MSTFIRVMVAFAIAGAAVILPIFGLIAAAGYVLATSFSLFGILLISATTLFAFKSAAAAIGIAFLLVAVLVFKRCHTGDTSSAS